MTALIQALGKKSWFSADGNTIINKDAAYNPDNSGGWELGTWFIGKLVFMPERFNTKYVWSAERGDRVNTQAVGTHLSFVFTEEDRQFSLTVLKGMIAQTPPGERYKNELAYEIAIQNEHGFGGTWVFPEWFSQLVKLFDDPNDLPVYYFA